MQSVVENDLMILPERASRGVLALVGTSEKMGLDNLSGIYAPKKIVETVHDRKLESVLSQLISSDDPQEFDMTHDHEKTMGILEGKEYRI